MIKKSNKKKAIKKDSEKNKNIESNFSLKFQQKKLEQNYIFIEKYIYFLRIYYLFIQGEKL